MTQIAHLIVNEQEYWLSDLPDYQASSIQSMLDSGMDYEAVASAWVNGGVASNTAPFSASLGPRIFFDKFLDQMHDLLCTGLDYQEERAAIAAGFKPKQTGLAASISAVIAPHLGASLVFLAPVVAVTLCAIGKMGLGAWCQIQTERRTSNSDQNHSSPESTDADPT
ncbi:hypothetical protein ACFCWV_11050 [Streptomyces sp. NPDC056341]|uniref:hypothetical protein n=1 Tax=Streptomyces sp. NPDC056341 TaxID=3345788 RepID=UPI0035E34AEA